MSVWPSLCTPVNEGERSDYFTQCVRSAVMSSVYERVSVSGLALYPCERGRKKSHGDCLLYCPPHTAHPRVRGLVLGLAHPRVRGLVLGPAHPRVRGLVLGPAHPRVRGLVLGPAHPRVRGLVLGPAHPRYEGWCWA